MAGVLTFKSRYNGWSTVTDIWLGREKLGMIVPVGFGSFYGPCRDHRIWLRGRYVAQATQLDDAKVVAAYMVSQDR